MLAVIGIMASPDDFGRLRLLLSKSSFFSLKNHIPSIGAPYKVTNGDADDEAYGEVVMTPPKKLIHHWSTEASRLHGKLVKADLIPRGYYMRNTGKKGTSLIISYIEEIHGSNNSI